MEQKFIPSTKEELLKLIKYHNNRYRAGNPEIPDTRYDALVEKLKIIDPQNEWFLHIEPAVPVPGRKVSLPIPMKSLNKVKNVTEVNKWGASLALSGNTEIICAPKFDGVSLLYDEIRNKAYSRGGIENEGQDCSAHILRANIPLGNSHALFTFGEFLFSNDNWDNHFKDRNSIHTGDPFKSPRNTAAGLLNRDEPSPYLQYASFYRYGVNEASLCNFDTYEELLNHLCNTYKQIPLYHKTQIRQLDDNRIIELYCQWKELYPIDGIVIYLNDLDLWNSIGRHQTSGNPLYAIACKNPQFTETFETTVKDISWKISKSGALKPVVNIETVNTGDCNMENPTGYNAAWVCDRKIAKGAKVLVTRSGGVIPKILKTLVPASEEEQNRMWDSLTQCPHCDALTGWNNSYIELCCTNPRCPGKNLAKIVFFYTVCQAENIAEETLTKIYNAGYTTIGKILDITFRELIQIDGFGEDTANRILENNKKIREGLDMPTLMHASDCFQAIGKIKARKIIEEMEESDRINFWTGNLPVPDKNRLTQLPVTMQAFYKGIPSFQQFREETRIPVLQFLENQIKTDGAWKGMVVCFSGIRNVDLEKRIVQEGGEITGTVSGKTNLLIVKNKENESSKISKAKSLNIKIINIDEVMD